GEDRAAVGDDPRIRCRHGDAGAGELRRGRVGQVGDEHAVVVVEQVQVVVGDRQAEQDLVVVVEVVLALVDQFRVVGIGQRPGRHAGAAVVAAPAGIEVVAVAGEAVDRAVGRGAGGHADGRCRVGVAPGRDHAAGGDVAAFAGDDRIGGHRAAAHQRERQRRVVGGPGVGGGGQGEGGGE